MTGYWDQLAGLAEKWLPALLQMELQLTVVILLALLADRFGSGLPFDNAYRAQPLAAPQENDERLPFTNELDLRVAKRLTYGPGYISVWLEVLNLLDRKNLGADPINAEWYLSREGRDGNGAADHLQDPTGRRNDFTVWNQRRRVKVGLDISW